jgi:hypothetical protein
MNTIDMRRIYLCIICSTLIATLCAIILPTSTAILATNQAFARCTNGTHMSPSGDCEVVVAHTGLPRCPNVFHRSPGGACEQVALQGVNGSSNISNFNSIDSNNVSPILANSTTNTSNMTVQSFNTSQPTTTSPLVTNYTVDKQCDLPEHPPCYSLGFAAGRAHPGTSCPSGYSFTFCEGYHIGSGRDIVDRGAHGGETDLGNAISFYLHHFPNSMGIPKTPTNTTTITTISNTPKPLHPSNTTSVTNTTILPYYIR